MDRAEASQEAGLGPGTGMALVAMAAAVFVVCNDFTAPSVALPTIERDFNADLGSVQWVINAYSLLFGILIVTGGRRSDDVAGHRRDDVRCAAEGEGRPGRRVHSRDGGIRERGRSVDRRPAHPAGELALALLPQR